MEGREGLAAASENARLRGSLEGWPGSADSPLSRAYRLSLASRSGISELLAEAVDGPEEEAEDYAEQDRSGEREGDRPSSPAPGEVAGKTSEGQMEAGEGDDNQTGCNKDETEEDEDAAKIGHKRMSS
ncbi:MAG: hypothetical protein JWP98_486 [Edaphobacter sp.]|nr:hypothetical protein [Edaphobacter sp.]